MTFNHTPAQIIRQLLINEEIIESQSGTVWPSFFHYMPDVEQSQKQVVSVFNTAPSLLGRYLDTGEQPNRHGLQIRLRSLDETAMWVKGNEILETLDAVLDENVSIDASVYTVEDISRTAGLLSMGIESETRLRHASINFLALLK